MRLLPPTLILTILIVCAPMRSARAQAITELDTAFHPKAAEIPYPGTLRFGASWRDAAGPTALLISGTHDYREGNGTATLHIRLYRLGVKPSLQFSSDDTLHGAGCDLLIDLPLRHLLIADLDGDRRADPLICYTLDNRCDAVPVSARMLVLHKGRPLRINGLARQDLGPPQSVIDQRAAAGEDEHYLLTNPDKAMMSAPKALRDKARNLWDVWVMEQE